MAEGEVVDSKRVTPAKKGMPMSQKVAEEMLPRWRQRDMVRGSDGGKRMIDDVCEKWGYSRKYAIKLLGAQTGWGVDPHVCE